LVFTKFIFSNFSTGLFRIIDLIFLKENKIRIRTITAIEIYKMQIRFCQVNQWFWGSEEYITGSTASSVVEDEMEVNVCRIKDDSVSWLVK